ncbi:BatA domain-containing protein [Ohtaekwangia koreensis]|uniref:N-terminal double-transmembrane domain-containing protein n=1 Tax=Ohtaekwangia koreensis TaxID=688867 RepID=A0A1T5LSL7_9BACT|nr:BatA domain-containing protein [Ohtaekwangia koreensis]SKC78845.1 N-terminal double-transmembrane domain-containing protein [Ohtaekwangia koreensis]
MNFLYPSFLWALGVLAIPVIIHLFNFRRTVKVYFSNNRFLKQVKEATTAKRRLKHYLILASRLLFLFFLVITFCQPIIPAKNQLTNNHTIVLYLDNSQSMSAQMEDKVRGLDAGVTFVRNIVSLFPPDTRYKLITNDFAPFSNSFKTKSEVLDLLTQVRLSPVSRTMQEVLDRVRHQGHAQQQQEVFWISDLQKSTLGIIPKALDSSAQWRLVPIRFASLANIFVDTVYLENPFAASGEKNVLRVKVRNDGKRDVDQLNLKLTINNIQSGAGTIDVPQGGVAETTFDLATGLSGLNEARISFNDFPVSFDNEFFFALNFTDKIKVVEIKKDNIPTPVEKVYGNKQVFTYQGFAVSNFNYNELAQADLVVVNGLNTVDPSLTNALLDYINKGGTLLLAPGTQPDVNNLKNLAQVPGLNSVPKAEPLELDRPDFSNPFFENVFEEKSTSLAMPKAARLLDLGGDRSAILKFKNDQAFLSLFNRGGKLYILATALESDFTDFHQHALFVPVMYRIAASARRSETKPYYTLRENLITLRLDSVNDDVPLKLVGKEEVIPGQRKVADRVFIDVPKFSVEQGFYDVVSQGDTVDLIAFNLNKEESLMEQYTGEEVKAMAGGGENISIFTATSSGAFSNEIKERYLGTPLWKYALLLALLFILAEILLIRFMK